MTSSRSNKSYRLRRKDGMWIRGPSVEEMEIDSSSYPDFKHIKEGTRPMVVESAQSPDAYSPPPPSIANVEHVLGIIAAIRSELVKNATTDILGAIFPKLNEIEDSLSLDRPIFASTTYVEDLIAEV